MLFAMRLLAIAALAGAAVPQASAQQSVPTAGGLTRPQPPIPIGSAPAAPRPVTPSTPRAAVPGQIGALQPAPLTPPQTATSGAAQLSTPPGEGDRANDNYILGSGDVLEVGVVGRTDYAARARVQTTGAVELPLIGSVTAAGLTTLQLADNIREKLVSGGFFNKPAVSVEVVNYASRYITVLGEVGSPGLVPIDRAYRVSEILARVGGVRDNGSDVVQLRRADGTEVELSTLALATGGPDSDPVVNPGDKMFVPPAQSYYIYGQINSPGNFKLERNMSLRMAVARSGGLTPSGSEKKIKVYRAGQLVPKLDLNAPLSAGDVIVVGERFF